MTMKSFIDTTKCLFCDGHIPASYDEVHINHMNDHHRAFVNIEFIFQLSLLGVDDLDSMKVNRDKNINKKLTQIEHDERPFICRFGCGFGSKTAGNRKKYEVNKQNTKSENDTKHLTDFDGMGLKPIEKIFLVFTGFKRS